MRFLREPLFHFILIGLALFVLFRFQRPSDRSDEDRIIINSGVVEHLSTNFARTWQRPPTEPEMSGMLREYVRDEVAYREALILGLDRDDSIVRRRMRQKLEFLSDETVALQEPSDDELRAFLDANLDKYTIDPEIAFMQVYVNPSRHDDAGVFAEELLARLQTENITADDLASYSDNLMLPEVLELSPKWQVRRTYGSDFAETVFELEIGTWTGPIRSGYGLHLVRIREKTPSRIPELDEVRDTLIRDWMVQKRQETLDAFYEALTAQYELVFEDEEMADKVAE